MSKITFTENGEEYWFDSETGETNYKGESDALIQTISSIKNTAVDIVGTEVESEPGLDGRERVYSPMKAEEMVKFIIEIESDLSLAKGPQIVDLEDGSGYDEPLVLKGTFVKRVYIDDLSDVPEGADVQQGQRGGLFYEEGEQIAFAQFQRDRNIDRFAKYDYTDEQVDKAVTKAQNVFDVAGDVFEGWVESAQKAGDINYATHRVKSVGSMLEKVHNRPKKDYDSVDELKDIHGSKVVFDTWDETEAAFNQIKEDFDDEIVEVKDKSDNTRPDGKPDPYRAFHLIAEFEGETVELQVKQKELSEIADITHDLTYKPGNAPIDEMETLDEPLEKGGEMAQQVNECLSATSDYIQGLVDEEPDCNEKAEQIIRDFQETMGNR